MKSLFQKSLVTTALVSASLALAGNAMAANVHAKTRATAAQTAHVNVAATPPYPNYFSIAAPGSRPGARGDIAARSPFSYPHRSGQNFAAGQRFDVRRLIAATLGGFPPQYAKIVQNAMRASGSHRSSGSSEASGSYDPGPSSSPSPDPSPPPAGPDTAGMNTSTNPTWPALQ
jgi:hypothetical protein